MDGDRIELIIAAVIGALLQRNASWHYCHFWHSIFPLRRGMFQPPGVPFRTGRSVSHCNHAAHGRKVELGQPAASGQSADDRDSKAVGGLRRQTDGFVFVAPRRGKAWSGVPKIKTRDCRTDKPG